MIRRARSSLARPGARTLLAVAALVSVASLAGCGDPATTLDTGATQRSVGRAVADQVEPPVAATTCPQHIPRGKGEAFVCRVRLGKKAGSLDFRVGQLDDDGGLSVEPQAAVLSGNEMATKVRDALHKQFKRSFQVDCGGFDFKVRKPGAVVECTARDRSSRRTVKATVVDPGGTLSIEVLPGDAD